MMKFTKYIFAAATILFLFSSCNENIKRKELEIQKREQAVLQKEKSIALIESDYLKLQKMRDSIISIQDSISVHVLPIDIQGRWNGKLVCTESNCTDYVVGDVRMDEWEISEDKGNIIAKNINKVGVIRVYTGKYEGNSIQLFSESEPTSPKNRHFKIEFTTMTEKKLSGFREIRVDNSCLSKFTIELSR